MILKKGTIRTDAGDKTSAMAGIKDRKKILPDKRFSTSEIDLKDLMFGKLIDQAEALIEGELPLFRPPGTGKAMDARKVASARHLPGHIDWSG